jgi:hypothetical protein
MNKAIFKSSEPRYDGFLSEENIDRMVLVRIPSREHMKFAGNLSAPFLVLKHTVPTLTGGLKCVEKTNWYVFHGRKK